MTIKLWDLGLDWVAAKTLDEALEVYRGEMRANGWSDGRIDEAIQDPHEETNMESELFDGDEGIVVTFGEMLAGLIANGSAPCLFASREY